MGLLKQHGFACALGAIGMMGCYAPSIRDCVLACEADSDCVQGQVCAMDHWCAAPALAGGCSEHAPDGGADGAQPDARPDAPPIPMVELHIHVDGQGEVDVTGGPTCSNPDCVFWIPKDVPVTLTAMQHGNHPFDKWTSMTCMAAPAVCTFTPTTTAVVAVKFK